MLTEKEEKSLRKIMAHDDKIQRAIDERIEKKDRKEIDRWAKAWLKDDRRELKRWEKEFTRD